MKKMILLAMILSACSQPKRRNFATENVVKVDENAKCVDQYTNDGPTKTHSTLCTLSTKLVLSCSVSTDKPFECRPLNGQPPEQKSEAEFTPSTSEPTKPPFNAPPTK